MTVDFGSPEMQNIARLADLPEFSALKEHFEARRDRDVWSLAQQSFVNPEVFDRLEWEKLRAFHEGVKAVFRLAEKARDKRKEPQ